MNREEKNLAELFGSSARVRILKLFLNNPGDKLGLGDLSKRTHTPREQCKKEVAKLIKLGLVKTTKYEKEKAKSKTKAKAKN